MTCFFKSDPHCQACFSSWYKFLSSSTLLQAGKTHLQNLTNRNATQLHWSMRVMNTIMEHTWTNRLLVYCRAVQCTYLVCMLMQGRRKDSEGGLGCSDVRDYQARSESLQSPRGVWGHASPRIFGILESASVAFWRADLDPSFAFCMWLGVTQPPYYCNPQCHAPMLYLLCVLLFFLENTRTLWKKNTVMQEHPDCKTNLNNGWHQTILPANSKVRGEQPHHITHCCYDLKVSNIHTL